jgi:hypothetical protein
MLVGQQRWQLPQTSNLTRLDLSGRCIRSALRHPPRIKGGRRHHSAISAAVQEYGGDADSLSRLNVAQRIIADV